MVNKTYTRRMCMIVVRFVKLSQKEEDKAILPATVQSFLDEDVD